MSHDGRSPDPQVSFEFFPPKSDSAAERLRDSARKLALLRPLFVSVTSGAAGALGDRTEQIVAELRELTGLVVAPHMTCVSRTRSELQSLARRYWNSGVRRVVALRGDPPKSPDGGEQPAGELRYASQLVALLRETAPFQIHVAAYPETHPEAASPEADLDNLKRKLDAGAAEAITQFFFDTDRFLRFRDRCAAAGIAAPVVPGVLPITNFAGARRFAQACGTWVPDWLTARFQDLGDDPQAAQRVAAEIAIDQVQTLRREGVTRFHFYTLNRYELSHVICAAIGIRPIVAA